MVVFVFVGENRGLLVAIVIVAVDADLDHGVVLILSALVVVCALATGHCKKDLIARGNTKAIGDNALFVKKATSSEYASKLQGHLKRHVSDHLCERCWGQQ